MPLIYTRGLSKTYVGEGVKTPALKDVSLSIEAGEFVAIMGPSGSGKSTLLHLLGLLDAPTSGTYLFRDRNVEQFGEVELASVRNKEMGFVFQAFNLLAKATVLENVLLPLYYSDVPERQWRKRAEESIAAVGLSHRAGYKSNQLSGGERQRVAIARALVNDPPIIFADEPTGNLDSASGAVVMETLQRLNEEDKHTIVLITHETETAEHAQRIVRIHDGRMVGDEKVAQRLRPEAFKK